MRYLYLLVSISILGCDSDTKNDQMEIFGVEKEAFENYPDSMKLFDQVWLYYQENGFEKDNEQSLNETQKALCNFYNSELLIGKASIDALLLSNSKGYIKGYIKLLNKLNCTKSRAILLEVQEIYNKYENCFKNEKLPSVLDYGSDKYDINLNNKLDSLENIWVKEIFNREDKLMEYFKVNKDKLIKIKE